MSKDQDDSTSPDAEVAYTLRLSGYVERSLLIILGGTTTVLAGFLSQVWGSAVVPFRTELAENLQALGTLFTASFALPVIRTYAEWPNLFPRRRQLVALVLWMIGTMIAFGLYGKILDQLGATIIKYAKLTS